MQNRRFIPANEPQPRQLIQLLGADGLPSSTWTRVRSFVSSDRDGEVFEVMDSQNTCRTIMAGAEPYEWLEVELDG